MNDLYKVLREGSCVTQKIIVGFSGGKDSVALLDLCKRYFKDVYVFWMYFVNHCMLQDNYFRYIEERYQVKILRVPHYELSMYYQENRYLDTSIELQQTPQIYFSDVENYVRDFFGVKWIAYGMMACESIERQAMLRNNGGIDYEHAKLYPLAFWNNDKVFRYLKTNNIRLPTEYDFSTRSVSNPFDPNAQILIKTYYPGDWEKVVDKFPYANAVHARTVFEVRRYQKNAKRRKEKQE